MRYRFPKPNDVDPIHRFPEPVPVECGWPISGSFQPRLTGVAVAWQGGPDGVTLVRLPGGKEGWVETTGVKRVGSSDQTGEYGHHHRQ